MVKRGSDMFLPLFEKTNYREGFLSGQVDPRDAFDKDAMLKQAMDLVTINPNVMIKIPGTKEGYDVIEILTSRGISTNNTLTFVLPQLMDCAKSVQRGLEKAKKNKVDLSRWRSVITHMEARYGDLGGLRDFAKEKGIELVRGRCPSGGTGDFQKGLSFDEREELSQQAALLFAAGGTEGEWRPEAVASRGEGGGQCGGHLSSLRLSMR